MILLKVLIASFGLILALAKAADIEQTWNISYRVVAPDGVEKNVPVVNGMYPGPEIFGKVGQTVRIVVNNFLPTETVTIHWHGIKQLGTPWSDGVPFVSQCPIGPYQSYVYEFTLDQPGTLWWHSHSGLQKSSLDGAIIIEGDEDIMPHYDEDRVMILTDWYHEDPEASMEGLLNPEFVWVGNPQSMLLNGKGTFDCSETTLPCNASNPESGPFYLDVEPNKTYRLRFVASGTVAFFNFGIDRHMLKVIEVETQPLRPMGIRYLDMGSGMTYSVLIKTKTEEELKKIKNNNGLFWMPLNMRLREPGPTGLHILRYSKNTGEALPRRSPPTTPAVDDVQFSIDQARRMKSLKRARVPQKANRVFTIVGTQNFLDTPEAPLVVAINNISMATPSTPILHSIKFGIESETSKFVNETTIPVQYNYSQTMEEAGLPLTTTTGVQVFKVFKDEVVDFVFQNTLWFGGGAEVHPWHLHLHDFWVLGYGDQNVPWSPADKEKYNMRRAPYRNTLGLYPNSWTAIRVRFNNPGAAIFHCHILPHLIIGMGFVVQIGEAHDIPSPPPNLPLCGADATVFSPPGRSPFH